MKVFTDGAFRVMNVHMGINPKNLHIPVLFIIEIRNWKHFHTTVPTLRWYIFVIRVRQNIPKIFQLIQDGLMTLGVIDSGLGNIKQGNDSGFLFVKNRLLTFYTKFYFETKARLVAFRAEKKHGPID